MVPKNYMDALPKHYRTKDHGRYSLSRKGERLLKKELKEKRELKNKQDVEMFDERKHLEEMKEKDEIISKLKEEVADLEYQANA
jgi:hypothetical protein